MSGFRNGGNEDQSEEYTIIMDDLSEIKRKEYPGKIAGDEVIITVSPELERPSLEGIYEIFEKINSLKDVIKPEIENHFECILRDKFIEIRIFSKREKVSDEDLERVSTVLGADECYFTNKTWHIRWFR